MKKGNSAAGFSEACRSGAWSSLGCFAAVYFLWGAWERWGVPRFWLLSEELTAAMEALLIKNLIWLLPMAACILMGTRLRWSLRSIFSGNIPWLFILSSTCVMFAVIHTLWLVMYRGSAVLLPFAPIFILLALCAGVTEELLFRGFLLNSALAAFPTPAAVLLNGACFVLIHFTQLPFGASPAEMISFRGLLILVMSTLFSVVLIRSRNLKIPMLLHAIWNLIAYFYGLY